MGITGKHIILKQVIDLEYNGQMEGFELQREVTDWCHRYLIPLMQEQLGKLRTKGKVYRIDKLNIAVELDAGGNWMANAATRIVQQVQEQVDQEIKRSHEDPNVRPLTFPQQFVEVFLYFLQHGHLPWWSLVATNHVWQEELENLLITGFDEKAKAQLQQLLKQPDVQQRVLYQVPDEVFIKLMVQINAGVEKDITNLINDLRHLVSDAEERRTVLTIFRQSVMTLIYEAGPHHFAERLYAHFVQQLSARGNWQHLQLNKGKLRTTVLKKTIPEEQGRVKAGEPYTDQEAAALSTINKVKQEGIFVQNAGLVIAAPFLPVLFKKLGMIDGTELTDKSRAVYLVQYIASGRERVAEFELGLAKILCGLDSATPVDTHWQLTPEEKTEVNELLLSAIEYWSILKDTSPDGLQYTFLQRSGKLQFINKEWKLQVEPRPYDVLLQHLPWSISMIKLPWMKAMLKTDWGYQ